MIQWLNGITSVKNFDKLLLGVLFLATLILCVHLMHKSDAGGSDLQFITFAEGAATTTLGALLGLIKGDSSNSTLDSNSPNKGSGSGSATP